MDHSNDEHMIPDSGYAEISSRRSRTTGKIVAAVAKAQANMVRPVFNKEAIARGGRKYKYADLGEILRAAYATYSPHGVAVITQLIRRHDSLYFVCGLHFGEEFIESEVEIPVLKGTDNPDQDLGARLTYRRRYCLSTLCGLFAEDDTDAQDLTEKDDAKPSPAPKPGAQAPAPPARPSKRRAIPPEEAEALRLSAEDAVHSGRAPTEDEIRCLDEGYRAEINAIGKDAAKLKEWKEVHIETLRKLWKHNRAVSELLIKELDIAITSSLKSEAA